MKLHTLKNSIAAFLLLSATVAFSACSKESLRGHGDVISKTRTVGTFDKIETSGQFEVFLSQGPARDIIMEGQDNVLANISTTTRNNKLKIEFDKWNVKIDQPVRIYITIPELSEVSQSGSGSVSGLTEWQVNDLELNTSGSGSIDLAIKGADEVASKISGSGQILLRGDAYDHELDISGSGKLKAYDLKTIKTDAEISGSGRSEVMVAENLKASISGSGKVLYKGSPAVNASVSGSGSVSKAD